MDLLFFAHGLGRGTVKHLVFLPNSVVRAIPEV
jgi:hypothetical protein